MCFYFLAVHDSPVGDCVGLFDGYSVRNLVGLFSLLVGDFVENLVGLLNGDFVGNLLGLLDGVLVGILLGLLDGERHGWQFVRAFDKWDFSWQTLTQQKCRQNHSIASQASPSTPSQKHTLSKAQPAKS